MAAVRFLVVCMLASSALALQHSANNPEVDTNEVLISRTLPGDSLLSDIMAQCFRGLNMEAMTCIRVRVLMFLDQLMGSSTGRQPHYRLGERLDVLDTPTTPEAVPREAEKTAADSAAKLDAMIAGRVSRLLRTSTLRWQLPETLFQSAVLTLRPANLDLDVQFPPTHKEESRAHAEARGILKKKLLLPVLLLLKLKMKALMPILVLISSIKAVKALIISKIALLVVAGFVFLQLCKKLGGGASMMMPAMMMPAMEMTPAPPAPAYGAPAPPMPYSAPAPAPPTNSYGPSETSWEPAPAASSNSYSRVWDSHQLAYKSYYNPDSSSSASSVSSNSAAQQAGNAQ